MAKTFDIIPASAAPFITIGAIGIVLILLVGLFAIIGYSSRNAKFEVSDQGLRISGGLYGQFIPREEIEGENAKIINLNTDTEYKPKLRTNGVGLPVYSEGWFKLNNNVKALLFVTDRSKVVYIPTSQDYSILLSVSNAEECRQSMELWK